MAPDDDRVAEKTWRVDAVLSLTEAEAADVTGWASSGRPVERRRGAASLGLRAIHVLGRDLPFMLVDDLGAPWSPASAAAQLKRLGAGL